MKIILLLMLIDINLLAMEKCHDNQQSIYIANRDDDIKEYGSMDPIFYTDLNYANTILIEAGVKEDGTTQYQPFAIEDLYKWLIVEKKLRIPVIERYVTDSQKNFIKLGYKCLSLIKDINESDMNKIIIALFKSYLDDNTYALSILAKNNPELNNFIAGLVNRDYKLTEDAWLLLKRFLRPHHLETVFYPLTLSNDEILNYTFKTGAWSLRKSSTYPYDDNNRHYCLVLEYFVESEKSTKENTNTRFRIFYQSGEGYYRRKNENIEILDSKNHTCFDNLIDLLNSIFSQINTNQNIMIKNNYFTGARY